TRRARLRQPTPAPGRGRRACAPWRRERRSRARWRRNPCPGTARGRSKTPAPKVVHLGGIGAVVVDEDAHTQAESEDGFQVSDRHHEAAVAGAEHGELVWIRDGEADG